MDCECVSLYQRPGAAACYPLMLLLRMFMCQKEVHQSTYCMQSPLAQSVLKQMCEDLTNLAEQTCALRLKTAMRYTDCMPASSSAVIATSRIANSAFCMCANHCEATALHHSSKQPTVGYCNVKKNYYYSFLLHLHTGSTERTVVYLTCVHFIAPLARSCNNSSLSNHARRSIVRCRSRFRLSPIVANLRHQLSPSFCSKTVE